MVSKPPLQDQEGRTGERCARAGRGGADVAAAGGRARAGEGRPALHGQAGAVPGHADVPPAVPVGAAAPGGRRGAPASRLVVIVDVAERRRNGTVYTSRSLVKKKKMIIVITLWKFITKSTSA